MNTSIGKLRLGFSVCGHK
uniref:Uncharacterized protein n=1 Tax=Anguilla anguilla TaxID=7936 RepID=A0A0E9UIM7_ANGAN